MAYKGEVSFDKLPSQDILWSPCSMFIYYHTRCAITAQIIRAAAGCYIEKCADNHCKVRDENGGLVGWIEFDCGVSLTFKF